MESGEKTQRGKGEFLLGEMSTIGLEELQSLHDDLDTVLKAVPQRYS